ncbi:MAG: tRNA(Ile)-lysidine synthase [Chloroflexi bacterium]|nr:MAG: tRNA(Ile)-lysidine synthase [Chloroflexota bacterium]
MASRYINKTVKETLETGGLLNSDKIVLAGVSGGADSLALLLSLHSLAAKYHFCLYAGHLNHSLRGEESDADSDFVTKVCKDLNVRLFKKKVDVVAFQKQHSLSLEEAARLARLKFLSSVSKDVGGSAMALGHTSDDQAETVLLNMIRGTGVRGLRAMTAISNWSISQTEHLRIIRPLLKVSHKETEAYCTELGITPRLDSSNFDEAFTRNRIRHKLIPKLATFNPSIKRTLSRLALAATNDIAYIDQQVSVIWPLIATFELNGVKIKRLDFNNQHPSIQSHLLHRAYMLLAGDSLYLNSQQIGAMKSLTSKGAGRSFSLPRGFDFLTTYDHISIAKKDPSQEQHEFVEISLSVPGKTEFRDWEVSIITDHHGHQLSNLSQPDRYHSYMSHETLGNVLTVRSRLPGDRFNPLGFNSEKKLKEFMIKNHVPRHDRDAVPLLISRGRIAWVVGHRIANWAKVTAETETILKVSFRKLSGSHDNAF